MRMKVETLYQTSKGYFPESDIPRDRSLVTDPELKPVGLVSVQRRFLGLQRKATSKLILSE